MENTEAPAIVPAEVRAEQPNEASLSTLREQLRDHESLTPVQVVDDVLRLNEIADGQIADPRMYIRALAENCRVGLFAVMNAPGEKVDAIKVLTQHYDSVQQMIIREKEQDQDAMSSGEAIEDSATPEKFPVGFTGSSSGNTNAASGTSEQRFGFNNDHTSKTDQSTS